MTENTFKVGDKVRLTHNNRYTSVKVGDIAMVTEVNGHGCMLRCGPDYLREHYSDGNGYHYFFHEGQFELVKEKYNLYQMYPWNGGECPVHPETEVKYWMRVGNRDGYEDKAKKLRWYHSSGYFTDDIVAFKIIKPYVEPPKPLEVYANVNQYGIITAYYSKAAAELGAYAGDTRVAVHLKEV